MRDKCAVMIYDALAGDSTAGACSSSKPCESFRGRTRVIVEVVMLMVWTEKRILSERAIGIEREAYRLLNQSTGNEYRASKL